MVVLLYDMVSDESSNNIIAWNQSGFGCGGVACHGLLVTFFFC